MEAVYAFENARRFKRGNMSIEVFVFFDVGNIATLEYFALAW